MSREERSRPNMEQQLPILKKESFNFLISSINTLKMLRRGAFSNKKSNIKKSFPLLS